MDTIESILCLFFENTIVICFSSTSLSTKNTHISLYLVCVLFSNFLSFLDHTPSSCRWDKWDPSPYMQVPRLPIPKSQHSDPQRRCRWWTKWDPWRSRRPRVPRNEATRIWARCGLVRFRDPNWNGLVKILFTLSVLMMISWKFPENVHFKRPSTDKCDFWDTYY